MWLRLRDSYTERKDSTYYPRFLRAFILRKRESGMPVDEKSVINLVREKCWWRSCDVRTCFLYYIVLFQYLCEIFHAVKSEIIFLNVKNTHLGSQWWYEGRSTFLQRVLSFWLTLSLVVNVLWVRSVVFITETFNSIRFNLVSIRMQRLCCCIIIVVIGITGKGRNRSTYWIHWNKLLAHLSG